MPGLKVSLLLDLNTHKPVEPASSGGSCSECLACLSRAMVYECFMRRRRLNCKWLNAVGA